VAALVLACEAKPGGVELIDAPSGVTDVAAVVRAAMARVGEHHRRLVVYVGATWCEPCQQIHAAIEDHKLDAEFPDLSLLVFDLDRDEQALAAAGYGSPLIPLFAVPTADGRGGPRRAWGGQHDVDNVPLLTAKLRGIY
jgi:hypothetical protein